MTDFLKRTAQMALGLTPLVQPVVVSRYAWDPHQPALETQSTAESSAGTGSEIAPGPDEPPDRIADPIPRRTQARIRESGTPLEGVKVWLRETDTRDISNSLRFDLANPDDQDKSSFEATALEMSLSPNTENMVRPVRNASARQVEEWRRRGTPTSAEPRREPASIARTELRSTDHGTDDARREELLLSSSVHEDTRAHQDEQSSDPRPVASQERSGRSSEDGFVEGDSISEKHSFNERLISKRELDAHRINTTSTTPRTFRTPSGPSIAGEGSRLRSSPVEAIPDSSSPPVVRVTIGRIEVRAMMPPSQPVEVFGPSAPKLSLDEYLRQHNGRWR